MDSDMRKLCILLQTAAPQGSRLLAAGALLSGFGLISFIFHMNTLGFVGIGLHGILLALTAGQRFHNVPLLWYSFRLTVVVTIAVLSVVCVLLETANVKITISSMTLALLLLAVVLCDMMKICAIFDKNEGPRKPSVSLVTFG